MPIDQLQEETGKVIQFYKIYENVNRKLIECISENSSLNKELNNTILSINQEKRKVDELLNSLEGRELPGVSINFKNLTKFQTHIDARELWGGLLLESWLRSLE